MRPCDCVDEYAANHQLDHQGVTFGDKSIGIKPPMVILTIGTCTLRIPMSTFKKFAAWFLEDQSIH